ncbi:hypothetical protein JCM10207_001346 [Rhodosporidiobolus poonsookiae]
MEEVVRSASLVLLAPLPCPAPDGFDYRVLLLQRHAQSSSYESAFVFPGGALDPVDQSASLARFLPSPAVDSAALSSHADAASVQSLTLCALRETFEESGLLLLAPPPTSTPGALERWQALGARERKEWRDRVHENGEEFVKMLEWLGGKGEVGLMGGEGVREWARWITPLGLPRRFDTTFFISLLPSSFVSSSSPNCSTSPVPPPTSPEPHSHHLATSDGTETTSAVWLTPGEAIRRSLLHTRSILHPASVSPEEKEQAIVLHPPQFNLLTELATSHRSVRSLLTSNRDSGAASTPVVRPRKVPSYLPRLVRVADQAGRQRNATVLPGDEAYPLDGAEGQAGEKGEGVGVREGENRGEGQGRRWNRTYVLPPSKKEGRSGLTVEGVHRGGMEAVLGEGWQDMQVGDVGPPASPPIRPGRL